MDLSSELKRREQRLAVIAAAKTGIEARAQARFAAEHASSPSAKRVASRTPGGTPPKAPERGPRATDQVNLTDAESRIMPTAGGGFEQADNAQAGVDTETHLIVAQHLADHTNDKQEIGPAMARRDALPEVFGAVEALAADTGYDCQETLERCAAADSPRPAHAGRGHCASAAHPRRQGPLGQAQGHGRDRLRHHQARAGTTAQFLLRGLRAVQGAWALACPGWNLKRILRLKDEENGKIARFREEYRQSRCFTRNRLSHFCQCGLSAPDPEPKPDRLLGDRSGRMADCRSQPGEPLWMASSGHRTPRDRRPRWRRLRSFESLDTGAQANSQDCTVAHGLSLAN